MAKVFFDTPPIQSGSAEERLNQLYRHLFEMSNKLNQALMDVSIEQLAPEAQTAIRTAAAAETKTEQEYNALKSQIIKSAEIVRNEMNEIRVYLDHQYSAFSEQFGEYQRAVETQMTATAEGVYQEYNVEERIRTVEQDTEEFINGINAYIFSGILDANNTVGIAIGYNVTNPDGTLNQANKMATFTADRLSFWINQTEAAYFSNNIFHIAQGEVTNSMRMGSYIWQVMSNGAMGLMKA